MVRSSYKCAPLFLLRSITIGWIKERQQLTPLRTAVSHQSALAPPGATCTNLERPFPKIFLYLLCDWFAKKIVKSRHIFWDWDLSLVSNFFSKFLRFFDGVPASLHSNILSARFTPSLPYSLAWASPPFQETEWITATLNAATLLLLLSLHWLRWTFFVFMP